MDDTPQQPHYHSEDANPTVCKAVATENPISLTTPELDMLIRSGTSLLSIVHPQQGRRRNLAKKDGDYRTLVRLDRIATLFVTKDKAAVSAVMVKQNVNITCIYVTEPEEPYAGSDDRGSYADFAIEEVYSISNSKGDDSAKALVPPTIGKATSNARFGGNWLGLFLRL